MLFSSIQRENFCVFLLAAALQLDVFIFQRLLGTRRSVVLCSLRLSLLNHAQDLWPIMWFEEDLYLAGKFFRDAPSLLFF